MKILALLNAGAGRNVAWNNRLEWRYKAQDIATDENSPAVARPQREWANSRRFTGVFFRIQEDFEILRNAASWIVLLVLIIIGRLGGSLYDVATTRLGTHCAAHMEPARGRSK